MNKRVEYLKSSMNVLRNGMCMTHADTYAGFQKAAENCEMKNKPSWMDQRNKLGWLRKNKPDAHKADRLYNIILNMFGKNWKDRLLDIKDIDDIYTTFNALYPNHYVSIGRLHYFLNNLRAREVIERLGEQSCKKCKSPFVHHPDDYLTTCNICNEKLRQTDAMLKQEVDDEQIEHLKQA